MAVVLALFASITYGSADFLGGLFSRRVGVFTVVLVSQVLGTSLLVAALPFFLDDPYSGSAVAWGAGAGVAGAIGVTLLFRGLSQGRMSIVAPTTGTIAAAIPVLLGLISGERPETLALIGVGLALVAVALVSASEHGADSAARGPEGGGLWQSGLPEALGAGTSFGLFFVLLDKAGDAAGLWPLVGSRASSITVMTLAVLVTRSAIKPPPGTLAGIAAAGALDVAANLFYLLATQQGLLSLVAVLTSMYPATTVLLARIVLKEKLSSVQLVGLLFAGAGIAAIAGA
jgi:drug/metabolite transporter (DMT)-like permease